MQNITPATTTLAPNLWWHDAAASPVMWLYASLAFATVFVVCLALRTLATTGRVQRTKRRSLVRDEQGTATIEFTLVLPILLFASLLLAQTTLLMVGNIFVHYSAFAATRSAIVLIPSDYEGEAENTILDVPGAAKHDRIRSAAVFALIPVSGRVLDGPADATDLTAGLESHYSTYSATPPAWVSSRLAEQYHYADAATDISVLRAVFSFDSPDNITFTPVSGDARYTFGPKEPVTVRVTHRLYLAVPYIGSLFADGRLSDATSPTSALNSSGQGVRYTLVTAQYTLTNEGISTDLPPEPPLQRIP